MIDVFNSKNSKNRVYGLDILRCVAILFVVFSHGNLLFPKNVSKYLDLLVFDGVSLFFVLSGFLIGGILIRELETKQSKFSMISFWRNRWFRTLPAYFLVLITLVITDLFSSATISFSNLSKYIFFVQNLNSPHPEWFSEAWSLSVEEWFYILMPLLLLCFYKILNMTIKSAVLLVSLLILLIATISRFHYFFSLETLTETNWDLVFRKQVFNRLDSLMYGVLGAYLFRFQSKMWFKYRIYSFILGILVLLTNKFLIPFDSHSLYSCVFSFSVDAVATLLLLPYLNEVKNGHGVIYKMITGIALISYSIYLVNYSLAMERILKSFTFNLGNGYLNFSVHYFLFWAMTIVLSILMYKYFELPMMNLRNKFKNTK